MQETYGRIRRTRRQRKRKRRRFLLAGMTFGLLFLIAILLSRCVKKPAPSRHTRTGAPSAPVSAGADALPELPEGWQWRETSESDLTQGTLLLVNRDYAYDPDLSETVNVYENKTESYFVRDTVLSLREDALEALNRWMDAFSAQTGITDVNVVAGWRSFEDQAGLYQESVEEEGQPHTDAYLALPGHSEHHTGLAVDLDTYDLSKGTSGGFDGSGDYAWAVEHAWEYGFVQRYPPHKSAVTGIGYESWHFRYVGVPHAWVMETEDLCLEEYIDYLRGFPFFGSHLLVDCPCGSFEIYFCPEDRLVVPEGGNFTVSGNNADGFIVTVVCTP